MIKGAHDNKLLTFMHIPKAAGTTLRKIIEKQYELGEIISFNNPNEVLPKIKTMSQQERDKIKCLSGHGYFGSFHHYFSKPFTYITLMRDPIDRVISEYYFLLNSIKHPDHEKIKKVSFEEFIRMNEFKGRAENAQTRYFSGVMQAPDIKKALRNINNYFLVVGTLEKFNESLFIIQKELGWKDISYTKKNITKNRPLKEQLSEETIKIIKEKNQMDIELYEYVSEQFEKKINLLSTDFKDQLNTFIQSQGQ